MIDEAERNRIKAFDMTAWFVSIANSVGADPNSRPVDEIVSALSAHHEFEQVKLQRALTTRQYNRTTR
jgi:hypothetical protein